MLNLSVRELREIDCALISAAFAAQGWHKPVEQYEAYFRESVEGKRVVLVADATADGRFAGYVTIVWESDYGPFKAAGTPEIVDFNVLKTYQRQGVGSALLEEAERRIKERSPVVGIGVGLTADYGAAQRLYVKRGYVPDGRGLIWRGQPANYGDQIVVDDDLVLYLTRRMQ